MNCIKSIYKVFKKIEEYDSIDHTFLDMYKEIDRLIKIKIDKELSSNQIYYLTSLLEYLDEMLESSIYISIKDYNYYNTEEKEKYKIIKHVGIKSVYRYRFHTYNLIIKKEIPYVKPT